MQLIALIGNKGGAGKTTLCVNLAAALAKKSSCVILDADPQQSSFQWYQISEGQGTVEVIPASDKLPSHIKALDQGYDYCLIDCPPSVHSPQMQQALGAVDLALIPVQPSPPDLWATVHVEDAVAAAKTDNPDLRAILVINQFESRTQLSQIVRRALDELSIPAAETPIKRRVAYRSSFLEGRTVHDIGRRGAAASEDIDQLILELEKYL